MDDCQLVVFRIGAAEYALTIEKVREIINYLPVTKLPQTPEYFEGIINVRGKIVPVVNFAVRLGLAAGKAAGQIIIVETGGKDVGITVDLVSEVIRAAGESFARVTESGCEQTVYKSADRIIILLDVDKVLAAAAA